jgi:hypothetical protein
MHCATRRGLDSAMALALSLSWTARPLTPVKLSDALLAKLALPFRASRLREVSSVLQNDTRSL